VKKKGLLILVILVVGLLVTLGATQGPGFYRIVKAKDRLNNGAIAYQKGDYDAALDFLKESLELNPNDPRAKLFYAATLYAKFNATSDKQLAFEALDIYMEINQKEPSNADAIAYIAVIYKNLADAAESEAERNDYMQKYREWTLKRLDLPGTTEKAKAEIYYTLGQGYWTESFQITQRYQINRPPQPVTWSVPESEVPNVRQKVQAGLEYLNRAIEIDPEYSDAWAYINLLYREQAKVETDKKVIATLTKQADAARNKAIELMKKRQQQQQSQPQS